MNIVLYVNSFLPTVGGRELVVHYLAKTLNESGHNVRVVGPAGWWSYRNIPFEYPVHRWPTLRKLLRDHLWLLQLRLETAFWGADVVHAHSTYPCGYIAAKLKHYRNIPLIVTPHGEDIHVMPEIGFGQRLDPVQASKIDFAIQNADLVTAISDSVTTSLVQAGASIEKIRHIPNGIDSKRFEQPVPFDVHKWLGFPNDVRIIITVGNYHPRKGHEKLIAAMKEIVKSEPGTRLVIVGRKTQALLPMIKRLNVEDVVRLTGPINFPGTSMCTSAEHQVSCDLLAALYQSSDVYVSAGMGEGAEGLSLALLEAMAAGLPVVATDISGNRDIVQDEKNGILISATDEGTLSESILKLLDNRELAHQMGAQGKKTALTYEWTEIAKCYLEVYEEATHRLTG